MLVRYNVPQSLPDDSFVIRVIVTDITYMKETFCVAGVCPSDNSVKRLLIDGHYWRQKDIDKLPAYSIIEVTRVNKDCSHDYPHKTEDTWIKEDFRLLKLYQTHISILNDIKPFVSKNLASAFCGYIKEHTYVPLGTHCPSLAGLLVPTKNIEFYKSDGKLRVRITDVDKTLYDLRVTCKPIRDRLDPKTDEDLGLFNTKLRHRTGHSHIRVGLSKPYIYQNNRCYLMCNGIFFDHE